MLCRCCFPLTSFNAVCVAKDCEGTWVGGAGGGGPAPTTTPAGGGSISPALTLGGAMGQMAGERGQAIKGAIGQRLTATRDFAMGGFLRKIPSLGVGGFMAEAIERRRASRKQHRADVKIREEEEKKRKEETKNRFEAIRDMKRKDPT